MENSTKLYAFSVTVSLFYFRLGMICPENYNLSDFIISKITARPPSVSGSKNDEKRIHELVENYKSSKQYYQLVADQSTAIINEVCYHFELSLDLKEKKTIS